MRRQDHLADYPVRDPRAHHREHSAMRVKRKLTGLTTAESMRKDIAIVLRPPGFSRLTVKKT